MSIYSSMLFSGLRNQYGKGDVKKYYNQPKDYDDFKKSAKKGKNPYSLKEGYISSQTPLHSGYGEALFAQPSRQIVTRRNPKVGNTYGTSNGLYIYNDPKVAQQAQQRAYQQQLQATASRTQADIAKQLRIIQNEKSAVAKLSADYSKMLKDEADRRVKAQEEAKIAAATTAANQSRQGQTNNVQVQPASQTPKTGGTKIFKKRGPSKFMSGISGMVNI